MLFFLIVLWIAIGTGIAQVSELDAADNLVIEDNSIGPYSIMPKNDDKLLNTDVENSYVEKQIFFEEGKQENSGELNKNGQFNNAILSMQNKVPVLTMNINENVTNLQYNHTQEGYTHRQFLPDTLQNFQINDKKQGIKNKGDDHRNLFKDSLQSLPIYDKKQEIKNQENDHKKFFTDPLQSTQTSDKKQEVKNDGNDHTNLFTYPLQSPQTSDKKQEIKIQMRNELDTLESIGNRIIDRLGATKTGNTSKGNISFESIGNMLLDKNQDSSQLQNETRNAHGPSEPKEIERLIDRDFDQQYDNELIMKVTDKKGDLPLSFHIEKANNDPILIFKDQNKDHDQNRLDKRETGKSEYDYYYEEQPEGDSISVKGGLKEKLSNIGKIFHHENNNTGKGAKAVNKNIADKNEKSSKTQKASMIAAVSSKVSMKGDQIMDKIIQAKTIKKKGNKSHLGCSESMTTRNKIENSAAAEIFSIPKNKKKISSATQKKNNEILSISKSKNCGILQEGSKAQCLPSGALPKNPSVVLTRKINDSDYEGVIKGDLIDKYIKTVLEKVRKNPKLSTELGICPLDIKDVRELYNGIRNKDTGECCMKTKDEFQCFLAWLLTVEEARKKRSVEPEVPDIKKSLPEIINNQETPGCSCVIGNKPSPQYIRLCEKIQEYKEENSNPWSVKVY